MAWNIFSKSDKPAETPKQSKPMVSHFSTPFGKIGGGDLSLPYVYSSPGSSEPWIRFSNNGTNDNLFPQMINQLYATSPLNSAIINFKSNAVIGGGFELESTDTSMKQRINELAFIKQNKFKKLMRMLTKDLIMHGRVCVLVHPAQIAGGVPRLERVGPEEVRHNKIRSQFTVCEDWSRSIGITTYPAHYDGAGVVTMYQYEIDGDAGQSLYPRPSYLSSNNWSFLDGNMSYLHKSNILNSIFPSMMITLAKDIQSAEELEGFQQTVENAKGAPNAGRIMTFIGENKDELPTVTAIPTNQNDKLFTQTDERIDASICRAHLIDPLIMGIRVSGKLGSGNEINMAYTIFEKTHVMPIREMVKEFGDEILMLSNMNSSIVINNYQIVGEAIVDKTQNLLD